MALPSTRSWAYILAVDVLLGATLGMLLLMGGLWSEARWPNLIGSAPRAGVFSVVTDRGFNQATLDRPSMAMIEALTSQGDRSPHELFGALGADKEARYHGEDAAPLRLELVFGDYFRQLGVPLIGRSPSPEATGLPLTTAPMREAVLSARLARRLFGTAEGAIGQPLALATFKRLLGVDEWAEFTIVGVVSSDFAGIDIERPIDAWLGINGWQGVLFPEQQIEDVRQRFGPSTLAVVTRDPEAARVRLLAQMRAAQPQVHVTLVPGVGYHPGRRARFLAISESLLLGLQALAVLCVVSCTCFGLMKTAQARHEDAIRHALGESRWRFVWRQVSGAIPSLVAVCVGLGGTCLAAVRWLPEDLPWARGMTAAVASLPFVALLAGASIGRWVAPLVMRVASRQRTVRKDAAIGNAVAGVLALATLAFAGVAASAMVGIEANLRALRPVVPPGIEYALVAPVVSTDRPAFFDRTPVDSLPELARASGFAMATTGPVTAEIIGQALDIATEVGPRREIAFINYVTPNYFDLLGLRVTSFCGPMAEWPAASNSTDALWILVDRSFLAATAIDEGMVATLAVSDGVGRRLRVCGVVDAGHVRDARAGLSPTMFARLAHRNELGAIVSRSAPTAAARARLVNAIDETFFDTAVGEFVSTASTLEAQLVQERTLVLAGSVMIVIALALALVSTIALGRAAIAIQARSLACRRCLGARIGQVIRPIMFGVRGWPWGLPMMMFVVVAAALWRLWDVDYRGIWTIVLPSLVACASVLLALAIDLRRNLRDSELLANLRSEH